MFKFKLPFPPTINTYWRHVGQRVLISRRGRNYRKQVMEYLQTRDIKTLTGPLSVNIELYTPDRRRRDVDNVLKAILDSLQWGGVYEDDTQIFRLAIEKILPEVKPKGRLKRRTRAEIEAGVELPKPFEGEALVWVTPLVEEDKPNIERICLQCNQPFSSSGPANRICGDCKRGQSEMSPNAVPRWLGKRHNGKAL
ncbi:Crossover junction endodeoxyribonuclease RusA [Stieleria bergensis]|uniref:Crossover junction endodeoxyribonuclease RusA n=1 Tax=Stieleria bergensis TaxID=2528025 RepID=A0A517T216_9BACT|nr:Crossover junction endodeoxyribonuclease RusA [Planctomycetes bacterium SV_7m_r]